jgi:hypothetical protein
MVDWKIYIDSPQKQALKLCGGSLTEGDGYGNGYSYGVGDGYSYSYGDSRGGGYGGGGGGGEGYNMYGNGRSVTKW